MIHPSYVRKGRPVLLMEMDQIFGDDLLDLRVVFNEEDANPEELYAFIKCASYFPYVSKLISSTAIKKVLSSYENPAFLDNEEVTAFIESIEYVEERVLNVGDVVEVKDGYLSGLTGIVVERLSLDRYRVSFKFHTRKFIEEMGLESLAVGDNVFNHLKFPVPSGMDNLQEVGIQWIGLTGIQFYGCSIASVY